MSWGTSFKTDIFINRQTFKSLYEVEAQIIEYEESIQHFEKRLMMMVAATPKDDVVTLQDEVDEILDALRHDNYNLELLKMFKEHLQETGKDPKDFID